VFSVNGVFVRKAAYAPIIRVWARVRSRDGFDYIVFHDEARNVSYFEAAHPEAVVKVGEADARVIGISYHWKHNSFVVVGSTGKILTFPAVLGNLGVLEETEDASQKAYSWDLPAPKSPGGRRATWT
jgi:hypothetical protein